MNTRYFLFLTAAILTVIAILLVVLIVWGVVVAPQNFTMTEGSEMIEIEAPQLEETESVREERIDATDKAAAIMVEEVLVATVSDETATATDDVLQVDYSAEAAAQNCQDEALLADLEQLLTEAGWYEKASEVPRVELGYEYYPPAKYLDYLPERLPFGYERVCAVKVVFRDDYETKEAWQNQKHHSYSSLYVDYSYSKDFPITVGSKDFYSMPADGPTAGGDRIPLATADGGLRYYYVSGERSFVAIDFPREIDCPCAETYTAVLTATMYPENAEAGQ